MRSRVQRLKLRTPIHYRVWRCFVVTLFVLLSVTAIAGGSLWLVSLPRFAIQNFNLSGKYDTKNRLIEDRISRYFSEPELLLLSKGTVFTANRNGLTAALLDTFPELKSAEVKRESKNSLSISLTDRQAWYRFVKTASSTEKYLVDDTGFVFAMEKGDHVLPTSSLRFVGSLFAENVIGRFVLPPKLFLSVVDINTELQRNSISVSDVVGGESNDFTFMTTEGWRLMVSGDSDARVIARSLLATLAIIDKNHSRSDLFYVDLRFPRKAYFKTREAGGEPNSVKIPHE